MLYKIPSVIDIKDRKSIIIIIKNYLANGFRNFLFHVIDKKSHNTDIRKHIKVNHCGKLNKSVQNGTTCDNLKMPLIQLQDLPFRKKNHSPHVPIQLIKFPQLWCR